MTGPFLILTVRSWKNRFIYRLKKLRELRYLLGAIVGIGYFGMLFFRRGGPNRASIGNALENFSLELATMSVLLLMLFTWVRPGVAALEFSEAEMHFLFTAPLTRRRILLYKLLRSQPPVIFGVLIAMFLGVPTGMFFGLWAAYSVMTVYMMFTAVAREWLIERGIRGWWIGTVGLVLTGGAGFLLIAGLTRHIPLDTPLLRPILFVPRLFAQALFVRTVPQLAASAAILAVMAVLFFYAAGAMRIRFEELVATSSERAARFRSRLRSDRRERVSLKKLPPLFRLPDRPSPELAIAWKNVIAVGRIAGPVLILVLLVFGALLVQAFLTDDPRGRVVLGGLSLFVCVWFPLIGGKLLQQDFRLDITRLDVVKTWPLRGERLIAAEIAAPLLAVVAVELLLLIGTFAIVSRVPAGNRLAAFATPQAMVMAFLFMIPVCAIQLLVRNSVPILFPGWAMRPREEQRGFAVIGLRLLEAIANIAVLFIVLTPAALVSLVGYWVARKLAGDSALALAAATMPAVLLLLVEAWGMLHLLGAQYDKLDATKDLEPGLA